MSSELRTGLELAPGDEIATWTETPTNVDVFILGTAYWTTHRIHYDQAWARQEGYVDVVITGVVMYGWVERALLAWAGSPHCARRFNFRHTGLACIGDTLEVKLTVKDVHVDDGTTQVDVGISITKTPDGSQILQGTATVGLPGASG
jgi:hydroxyacyl-ACP dehydratase HTD2-like protein with hotdog domain